MELQEHCAGYQRPQVSSGSYTLGRQVGARCYCFQRSGTSDESGISRQAGEANRWPDCPGVHDITLIMKQVSGSTAVWDIQNLNLGSGKHMAGERDHVRATESKHRHFLVWRGSLHLFTPTCNSRLTPLMAMMCTHYLLPPCLSVGDPCKIWCPHS